MCVHMMYVYEVCIFTMCIHSLYFLYMCISMRIIVSMICIVCIQCLCLYRIRMFKTFSYEYIILYAPYTYTLGKSIQKIITIPGTNTHPYMHSYMSYYSL